MSEATWKLALHESAHAVSAIMLGGRCCGVAIHNGAGGAQMDGLTPRRNAIATAAGPAGEMLSARFSAPTAPPATDRVLTVDEFLSRPDDVRSLLAADLARPNEDRLHLVSDARTIALWSITANEDFPETWAARVADVHKAATELVDQNAAAIESVARALYINGALNEDQIADAINGGETC